MKSGAEPQSGDGPKQRRSAPRGGGKFQDPLQGLSQVAQDLILASKAITAERGLDALTLQRVAEESGQNRAMVAYYFGGKAGLIESMIDSVIHDEYVASLDRAAGATSTEIAHRLIDEMRNVGGVDEDFIVFFELLPRVLREDGLRRRMQRLYSWYWKMKLAWLGFENPEEAANDPNLHALAQLLSAVIDGLAIQSAIDPTADRSRPYQVLLELVSESLPRFLAEHAVDGQRTSVHTNDDS